MAGLMSNDDHLRRAAQPTLNRIDSLAKKRLSDPVRELLKEIGKQYCKEDCSVYKIRHAIGATEWHTTLFRRELGVTVWVLIRLLRLETAFLLLRDTSLIVPEIAPLVGYKAAGGLGRLFRELSDLKPSEVRLHLRRVPREHRAQGEKLLSWYFRVKLHRGELKEADFRDALTYYKVRFGPS